MSALDDFMNKLQLFWATFQYNLIQQIAQALWSVERGFFMMGYVIMLVNQWLSSQAFSPLIQLSSDTLKVATSWAFVIALIILGITYMLAVFIRMDIVVAPRTALLWFLAGTFFFQAGPAIYQSFNDLRKTISGAFYLSALNALQSASGSTFATLRTVRTGDLGMVTPCDNFGPFMPGSVGSGSSFSGLDIALAYLRADGIDIMGAPYPVRDNCQAHPPMGDQWALPLPWEWTRPGSFFGNTTSSLMFPTMTQPQRDDSINLAGTSVWRLFSSWWLVLFGLAEQLVAVCLTTAQGFTFISFSMAILFAFFRRTEAIAWTVIDMQIELIIQMVVIAMIQAMIAAFFLAGAATRNPLVVMGVGLVCIVFIGILLWSGLKAIWRSFNRLFDAMGMATGGAIVSTGAATQTALGMAGTAAALAVTGGAAAIGAGASGLAAYGGLRDGATYAQAAGIAFGENNAFTNTASTLYRLPGLRGSSLGEAAEQFLEGAKLQGMTRDLPGGNLYAPFLGAAMLADRNPDAIRGNDEVQPMLRPTVGESMSVFISSPRWKRKTKNNDGSDDEADPNEGRLSSRPGIRGEFTRWRPVNNGGENNGATSGSSFDPTRSDVDEIAANDTKTTFASANAGNPPIADQRLSDAATRLGDTSSQMGKHLGDAAHELERAARQQETQHRLQMVEGTLAVSGQTNVAGVMGDLVALLQQQRVEAAQPGLLKGTQSIPNMAVANGMADVLSLTPLGDGKLPVRENLGRFQMYADQAMRMGVNGDQAERVVIEVKEHGSLSPDARADLQTQVMTITGWRRERADKEITALEKRAYMLPDEISAVGAMPADEIAPPRAIAEVNATPLALSGIPVPRPPQREMTSAGG